MTETSDNADALRMAVVEGDSDAVRSLLNAGVSPDVPDSRRFSPLHFAAQEYQIEAARILPDITELARHLGTVTLPELA